MKSIPLTQGYVTFVDDEDFDTLSQHSWCVVKIRHKRYAKRSQWIEGKKLTIFMHRQLTNCPKGQQVDHRDGDGLNNQKYNYRICSLVNNLHNVSKNVDNTSGFKGVDKVADRNRYRARISAYGIRRELGWFDTPEEAAKAYDMAAIELHGEFAFLNYAS